MTRQRELFQRYGPWAVVAGGTEGVGRSFAGELVASGFDVLLVARSEGTLQAVAAELVAQHPDRQVRTVAVDLSDAGAADAVARQLSGEQVGLLVLNAGANTLRGTFLDSPAEDVERLVALTVSTPLRLVQALVPPMRQRGRGGVVLVGSLAGYLGQPMLAAYSGVKAFSRVFAEGLWHELEPDGVDVLHVVLGVTRTPAMERAGLALDLPGLVVSDPGNVAREALAHLGAGPVHVIAGNEDAAARRSGPDRATLVRKHAAATQRLLGPVAP